MVNGLSGLDSTELQLVVVSAEQHFFLRKGTFSIIFMFTLELKFSILCDEVEDWRLRLLVGFVCFGSFVRVFGVGAVFSVLKLCFGFCLEPVSRGSDTSGINGF